MISTNILDNVLIKQMFLIKMNWLTLKKCFIGFMSYFRYDNYVYLNDFIEKPQCYHEIYLIANNVYYYSNDP